MILGDPINEGLKTFALSQRLSLSCVPGLVPVYKFLLHLIFPWKGKGFWVDNEADTLTFHMPLE